MQEKLNSITSLIESLNIDGADKKVLLENFTALQKELSECELKLDRSLQDKEFSSNALHATIKELKEKQDLITQNNKILSFQKKQIEQKHEELEAQKQLVVDHSKKLQVNLMKLETSYNELEQFAYIASHDLKSPLRSISNFAQILQHNYSNQLGEEADEFINYIVSGAKHMNAVICDLLEYSRVGNKNKDFTSVKLRDILDLAKYNLAESIKATNASIIIDVPTIELKANRSSMLQLFQNLISNSIKFCEGNTPEVRISCIALEGAWEFRIADNGVGIDESYQTKIFLPFQRLNNLVRPGTGIGLAICKKSIKIHSGEIRYESQPGEGTTFIFKIPQEEMVTSKEISVSSNSSGEF